MEIRLYMLYIAICVYVNVNRLVASTRLAVFRYNPCQLRFRLSASTLHPTWDDALPQWRLQVIAKNTSLMKCPECVRSASKRPAMLASWTVCIAFVPCRPCLEQMAVTVDGEVSCPLCQTTTCLPDGGVGALPVDCTASPKTDSENCVLCADESEGDGKPRFWCKECSVGVCGDHLTQHCVSGDGKHPVKFFQGKSPLPVESHQPQRCSKHKKRMEYFCVSCDECICGDCSLKGERHDGHRPIVRVEDVVYERRARVCKEADKLSNHVERLERGIAAVDDVSCRLLTRADEVRADIKREGERAVKAIDEQVCHLLQQVQDVEDSRSKQLDIQRDELRSHLQKVRSPLRFKEKLEARRGEGHEAMPSLQALEKRVANLSKTSIVDKPQQHSCLGFSASAAHSLEKVVGAVSLCKASAAHCTVEGELSRLTEAGYPVTFIVQAKDKLGQVMTVGGDIVHAQLVGDWQTRLGTVTVDDKNNGQYVVTVTAEKEEEEYDIEVSVNGEKVETLKITTHAHSKWSIDPEECHPNIRLDDGHCKATHVGPSEKDFSVLGKVGMRRGKHTWRVCVGGTLSAGLGVTTKPFNRSDTDFNQGYYWHNNDKRYTLGPQNGVRHNAFD